MSVRAYLKQDSPSIQEGATCVVGISVGQENHEGACLLATVNLLKKQGVRHFVFLVADSLQKYTLALSSPNLDCDALSPIAIKLGQQWVARNKEKIQEICGAPHEDFCFIHWDQILKKESFQEMKDLVEQTRQENTDFATVINQTVEDFKKRYVRKMSKNSSQTVSESEIERITALSTQYVIEECIGLLLLGRGAFSTAADTTDAKVEYNLPPLNFFVYPGEIIGAFQKTKEIFLDQNTLQYLSIRFRKVNSREAALSSLPSNVTETPSAMFSPSVVGHSPIAEAMQGYITGLMTTLLRSNLSPDEQQKLIQFATAAAFAQIIPSAAESDEPNHTASPGTG